MYQVLYVWLHIEIYIYFTYHKKSIKLYLNLHFVLLNSPINLNLFREFEWLPYQIEWQICEIDRENL